MQKPFPSMAKETSHTFCPCWDTLCPSAVFLSGFCPPTGYASEGQVKLEVLYRVQDTTVVLHRDWITYSKDAPCALPQQSDMGATLSASETTMNLQDPPQTDHTHKRSDTTLAKLLKDCLWSEWVGPPSSALVEELRASLQPLSLDDLAKVDCEVGASLEQGGLPAKEDMDVRKAESPSAGWRGSHPAALLYHVRAGRGGAGWVTTAPVCACAESTLLHVLAEYGMVCVVQYLVRLPGASQAVIRLDQSGRMPEEVAMAKDHHQLSQLLIQYVTETRTLI